ncbi:ferredoxin [Candidatus Falkowbacteria bacterium]|uniref:Ferredoxin n=1 Tax=Candidatus Buchananbacteria bacterium CG10_big_fil_rev_8_21_14_0_10_33_19 TaxID=1974525 RepID=A0A2H0W4P5_9BACT|nr:ferredoxin [Candidatus Falkowbacteria bacterium]PIS06328.1 MAG: ferredoxin [Candidatus Buchananbacteria bacterium CG10_big_fil_rev_8_21_14_0_10_33_19]
MKPIVNDSCIGCGTCEAVCPEVFKMEDKDDRIIAVVQKADYKTNKDKVDEAITACPVQAISWE